jgi:3-dehydroquinate synthase
VGDGILERLPDMLRQVLEGRQHRDDFALLVTDRNVARHHLQPLRSALQAGGFRVEALVMKAGERLKSHAALYRMLRSMVGLGMTRDSTVIALGGGVVGDAAGFAASIFMRGCHLVQVPTSLLAQVDSAIGAKVGINLPEGKNLVGVFKEPLFVLSDGELLHTLPPREFSSGCAEVVKYGLIDDEHLLRDIVAFMDRRFPPDHGVLNHRDIQRAFLEERDFLQRIIYTSARIKADIVAADAREQNLRMLLNFGHTFAHALEQLTGYRRLLHGEAVFIGMRMAVRLSEALGMISEEEAAGIDALLKRFPVPPLRGIRPDSILSRMGRDKKKRGGRLHFVVLERPGKAVTRTGVSEQVLVRCMDEVLRT